MPVQLQKRDTPIDLSKVPTTDLRKKAEAAAVSLSKRKLPDGTPLVNLKAQVMLLIDHSASMDGMYSSGLVQTLAERALGYALPLDDDGEIPVLAWDWPKDKRQEWNRRNGGLTIPEHTEHVATVDNYQGFINREVWLGGDEMGGTMPSSAIEHVHQTLDLIDNVGANVPIFLILVADGGVDPEDRGPFIDAMRRLSGRACFVKILVVADAGMPLATMLDDDLNGIVDNVDAKLFSGSGREGDLGHPSQVSDEGFAEAMADEVDTWLAAATAAGILQ